MKVSELVEELQKMNQEAEIIYKDCEGDEEGFPLKFVTEGKSWKTSMNEFYSAPATDPLEDPSEVEIDTVTLSRIRS